MNDHIAVIVERGKVAKSRRSYTEVHHKLIRHDCGDHPVEKTRKIERYPKTQSEPRLICRGVVVPMHDRVFRVNNLFGEYQKFASFMLRKAEQLWKGP